MLLALVLGLGILVFFHTREPADPWVIGAPITSGSAPTTFAPITPTPIPGRSSATQSPSSPAPSVGPTTPTSTSSPSPSESIQLDVPRGLTVGPLMNFPVEASPDVADRIACLVEDTASGAPVPFTFYRSIPGAGQLWCDGLRFDGPAGHPYTVVVVVLRAASPLLLSVELLGHVPLTIMSPDVESQWDPTDVTRGDIR